MTEWLDEAEREAWLRLVAVVELLPGVLDAQLRAEAGLTHFEYFVLAMLSEAPERTLRMTALAQRTNATLPRLSHVVIRLEDRGLVDRFPCPEDGRICLRNDPPEPTYLVARDLAPSRLGGDMTVRIAMVIGWGDVVEPGYDLLHSCREGGRRQHRRRASAGARAWVAVVLVHLAPRHPRARPGLSRALVRHARVRKVGQGSG